jgi:hypothetical protein
VAQGLDSLRPKQTFYFINPFQPSPSPISNPQPQHSTIISYSNIPLTQGGLPPIPAHPPRLKPKLPKTPKLESQRHQKCPCRRDYPYAENGRDHSCPPAARFEKKEKEWNWGMGFQTRGKQGLRLLLFPLAFIAGWHEVADYRVLR